MRKTVILSAAALILSGCVGTNKPEIRQNAAENTLAPEAAAEQQAAFTPAPTLIDFDALPTKVTGWGFVRKKGSAPEVPAEQQAVLAKYGAYYIGDTDKKEIYLTFDEGYENGYTERILDILKENKVPAAFFVTGPYLEGERGLVSRMIEEGHIVGNHTLHHPNLGECDDETVRAELDGLSRKCEQLYGTGMSFVRPPEGAYSERSLALTQSLGYTTVLWSHAYKDWDVDYQPGAENAIKQVVPYFHNGEILLLHAVSKDNADALQAIISAAREAGYEFKPLTELKKDAFY